MSNPFKLSAVDYFTGGSRNIRFNPEITPRIQKAAEPGSLEQRVAAQNREVEPKNFVTEPKGSSFVNGRGFYNYGEGFAPYFA